MLVSSRKATPLGHHQKQHSRVIVSTASAARRCTSPKLVMASETSDMVGPVPTARAGGVRASKGVKKPLHILLGMT
eukprot:scaffold3537_cov373-Prasinococcus_capsulatus_cf.AAC.1